jgi:hypothetical protein
MRSMDEDVDADESSKEFPLLCFHNQDIFLLTEYIILSKFDDMIRGNWEKLS